ncbi:hypothetical protein BDY24DRAFT_340841, partial [Mrakia frigida]|uniref:uncharacterized protein n=1 Tax=Mrakia frigida TaxID=29902 RepID=UPI003FCBF58F
FFHPLPSLSFNETYSLADGSFAKKGYSLPAFLSFADDLYKHLEAHHGIEERFMFPLLSKRMTASFGETHPESHRQIHAGLDAYHALLVSWKSNPSAYSPKDLRANMDSWREVLFRHLDEEVADLGKENMLKFWTLEEVRRLPI